MRVEEEGGSSHFTGFLRINMGLGLMLTVTPFGIYGWI